jgi:pimeloyl-ACP methyl ester carboxylesterase
MTKTIMLIHGAWLNSRSWEGFKARYEGKGYTVIAPDWPLDEGEPEELREHIDPDLARISQKRILAHYTDIIATLPGEPILIGHSLGGVIVQHLLDNGHGVCGVAIDPAPTPGVGLGPHAIVSALPVFTDPLSGTKVKSMSREFFKTRFAQTLPEEVKDEHYDRYIVPTPGLVYWNGVIGAMSIDWDNPRRAPLLLVAGGKDLIADASMTQAIYEKQKRAPSLTEFKLYPERSHWTAIEAGWEDVADFVLDWAVRNQRA